MIVSQLQHKMLRQHGWFLVESLVAEDSLLEHEKVEVKARVKLRTPLGWISRIAEPRGDIL